MTHQQSRKTDRITIMDRLIDLHRTLRANPLARLCGVMPRAIYAAIAGFAGAVMALVALSFSLANVVVHQGFESVAFATPAHGGRLIRQAEVAHFGNRVSSALGVRNDVAHEFADWILEAAERQHLAPELLASLVVTESSFRKSVRSNVGAIGPTQVRPDYWGDFCGQAEDLHDPEQNVYCGAQVLSHLLERCSGEIDCALAAYNVGPYASRAAAASRYVKKIDRYLSSFEERPL